ncbi:hypothetical protein [Thermomonospora cellulosilytica]|uniref:Uncharacterized protein n=1 Tax=Thermomonospora cellulosilytica TaxID=1411118 RepID=A0A7W3MTV3_9ACTN|nr:hypothetical protein [Thermomonospora cellulosilytica]MBA9001805.1 hypothetical protein [Thermomonospora cellulosilytica]
MTDRPAQPEPGRREPEYYLYEEWPVVFVEPPGGGLDCLAMNADTGEFQREMRYYRDIRTKLDANVDRVPREEFVQWVERQRGRHVKGEGPVFALYETIQAVEDTAREQGRTLTDEERALIHTLRLRTHEMFEAAIRERGGIGAQTGV